MKYRIIPATSPGKIKGPAGCGNTQLSLFDSSVLVARHSRQLGLCPNTLAEIKRQAMESNRKTYAQNWPAYTQAQVNEKAKFLELLYALCELIDEPPQHMGRPRIPLADRVFSAVFKVYEGVSGRRFSSDLREAKQRGLISALPTYSAVSRYFESEELTPILRQLITESSLPLKAVEWDFAVDSSGFSTGRCDRWVDTKWNKEARKYGEQSRTINTRDWLKCHLMCGVKTNIVTSVEITHAHAADTTYYAPLVEATSENFAMQSVCADKAYSSEKNLHLTLVKGAQPYIAFRKNATAGNRRSGSVWKRLFLQYQYNQERFMHCYHRRSNVETTFSMIKRKFGERLRSKTRTAQTNELLCKVLAHNLCCLVQSMYEFGVEVTFSSEVTVDE
jgi:transposase